MAMSAFVVGKSHIDALVIAAVYQEPGDLGPLSWMARDLTEDEKARAYQAGEPWGPQAPEIAREVRREATLNQADRIGQMLMRGNQLGVNFRYDENDVEDIYTFTPLKGTVRVNPVMILKAIDCLEYQSCDHPGWKKSEAHAFCQALRRRMIHRLPGYREAPWEVGRPDGTSFVAYMRVTGESEKAEDQEC
jgi:hypothetical protein